MNRYYGACLNPSVPVSRESLQVMHSLRKSSLNMSFKSEHVGARMCLPLQVLMGLDDPDLDVGSHPLGRALIRAVGGLAAERPDHK